MNRHCSVNLLNLLNCKYWYFCFELWSDLLMTLQPKGGGDASIPTYLESQLQPGASLACNGGPPFESSYSKSSTLMKRTTLCKCPFAALEIYIAYSSQQRYSSHGAQFSNAFLLLHQAGAQQLLSLQSYCNWNSFLSACCWGKHRIVSSPRGQVIFGKASAELWPSNKLHPYAGTPINFRGISFLGNMHKEEKICSNSRLPHF